MRRLVERLFPICRSITGNGVRETLAIIREHMPLEIHEIPTGTPVFDWSIPREWNIADAWIKDESGNRIVDFKESNLHVLNYSVPVRRTCRFDELRPHLFTDPNHPDWIPYRTSYYRENWGFCLSEKQLASLSPDARYDVCIDSTLTNGSLTYGEYLVPGKSTSQEVLISCHICHPSLANDNLSGVALSVELSKFLREHSPFYNYRFLFIPGTIGSIAWLAQNDSQVNRIRHGLVLTCVGDPGPFSYKRSRRGDAEIDRIFEYVLASTSEPHRIIDFFPYGYDERQYCSPGFNLPVGCFMRSQHGTFPEYHTSADNLDFISDEALGDSLNTCRRAIEIIEHNRRYRNLNPKCEPRLGARGLYAEKGGERMGAFSEMALLWVLNQSDGDHDLLAIAQRSSLPFDQIRRAADALLRTGLLEVIE